MKDGEDPKASLRRELAEELNISADVGSEIHQQVWKYSDGGEFEIHFFSVKAYSGEPKNLVFDEIRWVSPQALIELDLLEGSRALASLLVKKM